MRRRRFLDSLVRGAAGAVLLPPGALPGTASTPAGEVSEFTAWTWVHGGGDRTPAAWRSRFGELREAGFRGLLVSGGETTVLSEAARGEGLSFHRWMWILNRNNDRWAMENHPEWFTVNREGRSTLDDPPYVGYYRWVCPTRQPVREYLSGLVERVAADERVDGVHLDYIRHSDVILPRGLWEKYDLVQDEELPRFDYCYCEVCRSAFKEETGMDPLDLEDPPSDPAWIRFRWDSVTRLVAELSETVHKHGKPISAAVFPGPSVARRLVRQSWDEWPLDMVFPMLYHSFYEEDLAWIEEMVVEGVSALKGSETSLAAGLYLPDLSPEGLGEAIRRVRMAGGAGFSTFEMNGLTMAHLRTVRGVLRP